MSFPRMPHVVSKMSRLLAAPLIVAGCTPPPPPASAPAPAPAPAAAATASRASADSLAIDSIARRFFALDLAPGMAVAVVRGGDVAYLGGFGHADRESGRPATPETIFYIASTTKAFTGLAAAMLHERGAFSLDAPLSRYLPGVRLASPLSADSITIRSLLTHTHGISNDGPIVWRTAFSGEFESNDELVRLLAEHPPARSGRSYAYGNIGYNVAALAMDRATGRSWRDVLDAEIFRPLGMSSTSAYISRVPAQRLAMPYVAAPAGFERAHMGKIDANMQAAGGLVSSARDLARWLEAQLNEGRVDGAQLLPAGPVRAARRLEATTDAEVRGLRQLGYSLGWQMLLRGSDTLYAHGGGFTGYATSISFLPAHRIGVAVLTNESSLGSALAQAMTSAVYTHFAGPAPGAGVPDNLSAAVERARQAIAADRARRAARSQQLPHPLSAYVGVFENPAYGRIELRLRGDRLEAVAGAASSAVEVFDADRNRLRVELSGNGSVVDVEMENGRAARLIWNGIRFTRV